MKYLIIVAMNSAVIKALNFTANLWYNDDIKEALITMSNIKPVSDLRNYNDVLKSCQPESPVFLTKNGSGKYVLMEIHDYEKIQATMKLLAKLEEGEKVAREEGWLSIDDLSTALGL